LSEVKALGELGLVDPAMYRRRFDAFARNSIQSIEWSELWPPLAVEAYVQRFRAGTLFRRG
jgi:hypothetical protein